MSDSKPPELFSVQMLIFCSRGRTVTLTVDRAEAAEFLSLAGIEGEILLSGRIDKKDWLRRLGHPDCKDQGR